MRACVRRCVRACAQVGFDLCGLCGARARPRAHHPGVRPHLPACGAQLLVKDPMKRMSLLDVASHPWIVANAK